MTDKCAVDGCQVDKNGVCALHEIEVERRQGMKDLVDNIPRMMSTINRLVGLSTLFLFIASGSYLYTYISKKETQEHLFKNSDENSRLIAEVAASVNMLSVVAAKNENESKNTMLRIDRLSRTMEKYIEIQRDSERDLYRKSNPTTDK